MIGWCPVFAFEDKCVSFSTANATHSDLGLDVMGKRVITQLLPPKRYAGFGGGQHVDEGVHGTNAGSDKIGRGKKR